MLSASGLSKRRIQRVWPSPCSREFAWPTILVCAVAMSAGACRPEDQLGSADRGGNATSGVLYGLPYDPDREEVLLFGSTPAGSVVQAGVSPSGDWIVYCKVVECGAVDLFRMHRDWASPQRLSDTPGIEFDPDIDDQGRVAYAYHDHRVDESVLMIEGRSIETGARLHKATRLVDGNLYAHGSRLARGGDQHWLVVVELESDRVQLIDSPLVISSIDSAEGGKIRILGHLVADGAKASAFFDPEEQQWSLCDRPAANCGEQGVDEVGLHSKLLAMATHQLMSNDPLNNLSSANNHLGRLSWKAAFRLGALVDLLDAGIDEIGGLDVGRLATTTARSLMSSVSWDPSMPGWPARKYSISRQVDLDLLVNNAAVIYPLVRFVNSRQLRDPELCSEIIRISAFIHDRNEALFDPAVGQLGGYRFRKGIDYQHDGLCLPFNQQNLWGLALLELHRATGEARYLQRARALAQTFRAEMELDDSGAMRWQYWPRFYLRGWTASEGISINLPQRRATIAPWYEDFSHAGINVEFVLRSADQLDNTVFSVADVKALGGTLDVMGGAGPQWSYRVAGELSEEADSCRYRPIFGWLGVAAEPLAERQLIGAPSWYPYFEEDPFACTARLLAELVADDRRGATCLEQSPQEQSQ